MPKDISSSYFYLIVIAVVTIFLIVMYYRYFSGPFYSLPESYAT